MKRLSRFRLLAALGLSLIIATPALSDASPAKKRVEQRLQELKAHGYMLTDIGDPLVRQMFPGKDILVVRFRTYPIGFVPPSPLRAQNIFVVNSDGSGPLKTISSQEQLKPFFIASMPRVKSLRHAEDMVRVWLSLSENLVQDGLFHFDRRDIRAISARAGIFADGKSIVKPEMGNTGYISVRLVFRTSGYLVSIGETVKVHAGVRPICQAKKLLDPDLTVRTMAERELLIMGRNARPYLEWIRPQLSADLQAAVDSIWQRIQLEDR